MLSEDLRRHAGKFYGKYAGTVVDIADDLMLGRILVRVPSVFGLDLTVRARPCFAPGHFFVPPVDSHVWVEFEAGDPQYPLWVGTWYPEGSAPTESQVDPPQHRVVHTPSGHIVEISDEDGAEKITIRHKQNAFIAIDENGSVTIANKSGAYVFLNAAKAEATITAEQGHVITMKAGGMALVNAGGTAIDLTGDTARITAATIILDATTVAIGNGADEPTIKATSFETLWNFVVSHVHPSAMGPTGPGTPPIMPLTPLQTSTAVLVK
jgi:hypothetical protein